MSGRAARRRFAIAAIATAATALAAALVAGVSLLAVVLVTGDGVDGGTGVAAVVAAAAVGAIGWPPAHRLVRSMVDRVVRGTPRTPEDVLRAFQHGDGREAPVTDLLVQVGEAVMRSFRATSVELWQPGDLDRVDDPDVLERIVSVPAREHRSIGLDPGARRVLGAGGVVGRAWAGMWLPSLVSATASGDGEDDGDGDGDGDVRLVPATHAGRVVAVLTLRRAPDTDRFSPADDAALADLGRRLGLVLHNRHLDATLQDALVDLRRSNDELRASRIRLVAAADAERRRLERDLHDGAQQHLVALAVDLRLAADEIAADPTVAPARFASLADEVRDAIAELRSLAHGIYPPLLADQGLVEALRVSARRSPSPVTLTADRLGRFAPEVEAAAYFCCMEALQNAAKHAAGAAVRILASVRDGRLEVVVEDDGPGFETGDVRQGQGLVNMRDRIGAAGGSLSIGRSRSGGTRLVLDLPAKER